MAVTFDLVLIHVLALAGPVVCAQSQSSTPQVPYNPEDQCQSCGSNDRNTNQLCCLFYNKCCQVTPSRSNLNDSICAECQKYGISTQKCCFIFGGCCIDRPQNDNGPPKITEENERAQRPRRDQPMPPIYQVIDCRDCQKAFRKDDNCCDNVGICCYQSESTRTEPLPMHLNDIGYPAKDSFVIDQGYRYGPDSNARLMEMERLGCGICLKFKFDDAICCNSTLKMCCPPRSPSRSQNYK